MAIDYLVVGAGTWQMVNQWVAKRFVMEINCGTNTHQPTPQLAQIKNPSLVSIYPNPANDNVTARVIAKKDESIQVAIFNAQGQVEIISSNQLLKGSNEISFEIHDLESGVYYLKATGDSIRKVIRFVKMD